MPSSSAKVYDPYRSISGFELSGTLSPSNGTFAHAPRTRLPAPISTDGCRPPPLSRRPRNMYWDTTDAVAVHVIFGAAGAIAGAGVWANETGVPATRAPAHARRSFFFIGVVRIGDVP